MMGTVATTGDKLKRMRRASGLTQKELAEQTGLSQSTIAQIETNVRQTPHPRTLKKLADALGINALDLLED